MPLELSHGKQYTVKPVLSSHSKIDKIKVLKIIDSLMKVKSKTSFWSSFLEAT